MKTSNLSKSNKSIKIFFFGETPFTVVLCFDIHISVFLFWGKGLSEGSKGLFVSMSLPVITNKLQQCALKVSL